MCYFAWSLPFHRRAMTALIPKESVTRFLGEIHPNSFLTLPRLWPDQYWPFVRVPSCHYLLEFIKRAQGSVCGHLSLLCSGGNILALAYTGVAIGADLAFAGLPCR